MLGFRFPAYVEGIEVAGYHLHFVSDDRSRGGHVLDSRSDRAAGPARSLQRPARRAAAGRSSSPTRTWPPRPTPRSTPSSTLPADLRSLCRPLGEERQEVIRVSAQVRGRCGRRVRMQPRPSPRSNAKPLRSPPSWCSASSLACSPPAPPPPGPRRGRPRPPWSPTAPTARSVRVASTSSSPSATARSATSTSTCRSPARRATRRAANSASSAVAPRPRRAARSRQRQARPQLAGAQRRSLWPGQRRIQVRRPRRRQRRRDRPRGAGRPLPTKRRRAATASARCASTAASSCRCRCRKAAPLSSGGRPARTRSRRPARKPAGARGRRVGRVARGRG